MLDAVENGIFTMMVPKYGRSQNLELGWLYVGCVAISTFDFAITKLLIFFFFLRTKLFLFRIF